MTHELKTWSPYFLALWEGHKTFEVRENDRDYGLTDLLHLREFDPCKTCSGTGRVWDVGDKMVCGVCQGAKGVYTGKEMTAEVTYVMDGGRFGVEKGYVVMGIKIVQRCGGSPSGRYHKSASEISG